MDNPKVIIGEAALGKGLFASEAIFKDEVIAVFDGKIYEAKKASDLPQDAADHAIQVSSHQWKDSNGIARFINHSCEPNVGYRGVDTLVAMRDVKKGEELTLDYEMSENSDRRMMCKCKTPSCRTMIGSFANLPEDIKKEYGGYVSDWLK
jgi:uncharacterized protein